MSRMTVQKLLLITCVAGLVATAATTMGHAEKTSTPNHPTPAATYHAAPQMCPATLAPATRMPAYKRYLKRTLAPRFTRRRS